MGGLPRQHGRQDHLRRVEESYDRIAEAYAVNLSDELVGKPADRDQLNRLATRTRGQGIVCDMGCGPGQIGRYLHDRGVEVIGIDLSAEMLAVARRLNPAIEFRSGNMLALDEPDDTWAAIVAFYSIIHIPRADVTVALREMARILQPGGLLLMTFHLGDLEHHNTDMWGVAVDLDYWFFTSDEMAGYIRDAGLVVDEIIERDPYGPNVEYQGRRAAIWTHKPTVAHTP